MRERSDTISSENARLLKQRIARTLELEFADQDAYVTVDGYEVRLEIPCPSAAAPMRTA